MSQISKAMLMAAGLGTRLQPFTQFRTKALLPLMGIPMAQYAVDSLAYCGVTLIVANMHHDAKNTQQGLQSLVFPQGRIEVSDESDLLLGSAGGIRKALSSFGDRPFFLSNADVLCDLDWTKLAIQHARLRSQWGVKLTLAVFQAGPVGGAYREIYFDRQKQLITGLGDRQVRRPFFIGAAVLEPEAVSGLREGEVIDFVEKILSPAIEESKAGVFVTRGYWYDIGSPSLWLDSHLSMIQRLETRNFRSQISHLWLKKISEENQRMGEKIWIAQGSPPPKILTHWKGPAYWDGRNLERTEVPNRLGSQAVLYGKSPGTETIQNGIGYGGVWVENKLHS